MYKYTQPIRDYINQSRRQHILAKDKTRWNQLCSALDVLEDAELAIDAYLKGEVGGTDGGRYLAAYGILQAIFLQQDAAFNLCEALRIPASPKNYPRLEEIREIRHESAGHPTKRDRGPRSPSYHFISRPSLSENGFDLLSHYADSDEVEIKRVSIPDIVDEQSRFIGEILEKVLSKLHEEERAHKAQFAMTKLTSAFPQTISYHVGKAQEATERPEQAALGEIAPRMVQNAVQKFIELLAERGIELDTFASVRYYHDEASYAIGKLAGFFGSVKTGTNPEFEAKIAYIIAWYLGEQVKKLETIAQELDEYYASWPQ